METKVLNYRIIIKPTKEGNKTVYLAECPTLGVYDWGDTIDKTLKSIKEGIECEIEGLIKDGETVPVDHIEQELTTTASVNLPSSPSIAFSA
jgi:predicted RNase H-like HicB family nuclease